MCRITITKLLLQSWQVCFPLYSHNLPVPQINCFKLFVLYKQLHCSILIQKTKVEGRNTAEITKDLKINGETGHNHFWEKGETTAQKDRKYQIIHCHCISNSYCSKWDNTGLYLHLYIWVCGEYWVCIQCQWST